MDTAQNPASLTSDSLELWFQRVYNEIAVVEQMLLKKEGFLFFKSHSYSEDELLQSPQMKRIDATIAQIENAVTQWMENKALSDERAKFYWQSRLELERRLGGMRVKIAERKPTFWEGIINTLLKFINFVMKHLPMLPAFIMQRLGLATGHQLLIQQALGSIDIDDV